MIDKYKANNKTKKKKLFNFCYNWAVWFMLTHKEWMKKKIKLKAACILNICSMFSRVDNDDLAKKEEEVIIIIILFIN